MSMTNFEVVASEDRFLRVMDIVSRDRIVGIDIESNGFFRYPERICLVQISTSGRVYLIDPLAIQDMSPLGKILADGSIQTVLHSGDHDIRSLDRDWGFRVGNLFDTSIAAAFVGIKQLGLASTLQEVMGVAIPKDKKVQRSDWTIRPLSDVALTYAAEDVRHLLGLRDKLAERLRRLGRAHWVEEECDRLSKIRYLPPDPDMQVFSVKGARDLDGRGLAILKALLEYRERYALRRGRPHFRVIPNAALVSLASQPNTALRKIRGLGMFGHGKLAAGLRAAVERGKAATPLEWPRPPRVRRLDRADRMAAAQRLEKLKAWRAERGALLSLDPALVWPMASMKRLASFPDDLEAEIQSPEIRQWQRAEFEGSLRRLLRQ